MQLNMRSSQQIYWSVVVAGLLILTAWGNAAAMLIFSAIAAGAWIVVPAFRGQCPLHRALLAGAVGVVVAFVIGFVMALN